MFTTKKEFIPDAIVPELPIVIPEKTVAEIKQNLNELILELEKEKVAQNVLSTAWNRGCVHGLDDAIGRIHRVINS